MGSELLYGVAGLGAALVGVYGNPVAKDVWDAVRGRNILKHEETIALLLTPRGRREWRPMVGNSPPDGFVRVPIVDAVRTSIDTSSMERIKTALRSGLASSGRSSEDWRCVYFLHTYETANYRAMWNFNTGNRKQIPLASEESIREGFVYLRSTVASGVFGLIDRVRSFDLYASFSNFTDGLRGEREWLERNGYNGVLEGYQRGGFDGLRSAIEFAARRGYWGTAAKATPAIRARVANARAWWERNARLYGTTWER